MLNKEYIWILVCTAFFMIIVLTGALLIFSWNRPSADDVSVEVSLPVIDWDRYLKLSKHIE